MYAIRSYYARPGGEEPAITPIPAGAICHVITSYSIHYTKLYEKAIDVEQVLTEEFQVKIPAIGAALSKFFGVPYEPFKSDRVKPMELLKNLKREYVEQNQWLPIDDSKERNNFV